MNDLQTKLFETVRHAVNNKKRWIDEVAGVLHKSKQAVYKKIQGESCLTLDEAVLLASHYQVMLDPLIRPDPFVHFVLPQPGHTDNDKSTRDSILEFLDRHPDTEIWCAGMEIPFLHDHLLPEIAAFRQYLHGQISTQPTGATFCLEGETKRMQERLKESRKLYACPTIEFWNPMILDVTLSQIRFALQSRFFRDSGDAFLLCDALTHFLRQAEEMAVNGTKRNGIQTGGSFALYCNEIAQQLNMLLLKSTAEDVLYLGFVNPPYLVSQSGQVIFEAKEWLERLKNHATRISGPASRERATLFASLRKRIDRTRVELEAIVHLQEL